jgi:ribosomal protein S18 acetylase RimI-like enzyme
MPDHRLDGYTVPVREAAWRRNLATVGRDRRTSVFERDGVIIGFATVGPNRDAAGEGELWALYVAPDAWGTGAGSALMADGMAFLRGRGLRHVVIWVLDGNARAVAFYQANGFRLDGKRVERDGLREIRLSRDL